MQITIRPEVKQHKISRYLYGHFAEHIGRCIYNGIWAGEDSAIKNEKGIRLDTAEALKKVALPALRWPGGCFADSYHWKDGIGPKDKRPKRHNLWWNQPETNQFGTDEFMRFCARIGTEPYICVNVGSGTVEEACAWVEYCNSSQDTAITGQRRTNGHPEPYNVKFWGVGNENWGCGGAMEPEHYADLYRQFAGYMRPTGGDIKLIACGSHPGIIDWDERFLVKLKPALGLVDYIALHIYTGGSPEVNFTDEDYYRTIAGVITMDDNIKRASGLTQSYSAYGHPIGVIMDEWGTWYKEAVVENGVCQQSTMRDALFTAASFHCFHKFDRLFMTNMAQTVNVLQALILTKGSKAVLTPTYHVYEMFMPHRDAAVVPAELNGNPALNLPDGKKKDAVSVSASVSDDGKELFVSIANLDLKNNIDADLRVISGQKWEIKEIRQLSAKDIHTHNTFEEPDMVKPAEIRAKEIKKFPAMSVTAVKMKTVS
ncbi:alpha-N-arabinofuranosidase [Candidatus Desantisbacteria bacterium CG02_land_8_20_14_3_00_49_13]|nr:MAG: alpha-N-arabinofuranosidase [Candidatus Desantisbacteria bacterium CG02_land_8_20_14_3_00_49_13]PJB27296.1 MAG: alpha-N-arabinofuranosidase [Candidatus Desantisbacteria bacterium CG_4_9_14_3_um_filter_50_7]